MMFRRNLNGLGMWPFDPPQPMIPPPQPMTVAQTSATNAMRSAINHVTFAPQPPLVDTMVAAAPNPTTPSTDPTNTVDLPTDTPWYQRPVVLIGLAVAGYVGYRIYKAA